MADKLKNIDIGILVLNAGVGGMGPFVEMDGSKIQEIVNVNALQVVYMAKAVLPMMLRRDKKAGLVVVSSGLGHRPVAGTITYSSTKSFASFIAEGLNYELEGKVDCMSYQAGEVTTKMLRRFNTDSRTITPQRAADTCFRDLGYTPMTRGSFRHEWTMFLFGGVPLRWAQFVMYKAGQKVLRQQREKEK